MGKTEDRRAQLRAKSMCLPLLPGVYIMKNTAGEIIYIGKAKALKNRVSQYFGSPKAHTVKVRKMVGDYLNHWSSSFHAIQILVSVKRLS